MNPSRPFQPLELAHYSQERQRVRRWWCWAYFGTWVEGNDTYKQEEVQWQDHYGFKITRMHTNDLRAACGERRASLETKNPSSPIGLPSIAVKYHRMT